MNDQAEERYVAQEGEYVAPEFLKEAFHCPYCGVLAPQEWCRPSHTTRGPFGLIQHESDAYHVICDNCHENAIWVVYGEDEWRMIRPETATGPRPHPLMPKEVRGDYEEARSIVSRSPRGAGALARLAAQKLVDQMESGNSSLNDKIAAMVKKGLPEMVQQSLDALRVVGNNCVHPGEMVMDDDAETVTAVLECMNIVVEDRVARPQRVTGLYGKLPEGIRKAIEKRDKDTTT